MFGAINLARYWEKMMNSSSNSISVIIPVYNSEESLVELSTRLMNILPKLTAHSEIVFVNDGSTDGSWQTILSLSNQYACIRGLDLMRNYSQHNALLCGIRSAKYEIIITIDDDLQNPPEEIPELIDKLAEGYDVVYGVPQQDKHDAWRTIASQVTKFALSSSMGVEVARNVSAFRAFRTQIRKAWINFQGPFASIDVLLTWGTSRFTAIPVQHNPRRFGKSNYTLIKLLTHAFNMITGFTVLPLQFASLIGFSFTIFGMLILLYVFAHYIIQGGSVPGFSFLASIILIFSGAQLLALGIIGEYLGRMHFRIMDKPIYTVRSRTNGSDNLEEMDLIGMDDQIAVTPHPLK
jgi:glycosyltransferase involved in cell wall biosynthesis